MTRWWIAWLLFAAIMGFAVGGSVFWGVWGPNVTTSSAQHQAAEKVTKDGERAQSLWIPTDSVGLYTLVLAAFTFLLVVVSGAQGFFLLRADKTARITANAADLSARAAVALELPVIRMRPDNRLGFETVVEFGNERHSFFLRRIAITNAGRTQAFPVEIIWG